MRPAAGPAALAATSAPATVFAMVMSQPAERISARSASFGARATQINRRCVSGRGRGADCGRSAVTQEIGPGRSDNSGTIFPRFFLLVARMNNRCVTTSSSLILLAVRGPTYFLVRVSSPWPTEHLHSCNVLSGYRCIGTFPMRTYPGSDCVRHRHRCNITGHRLPRLSCSNVWAPFHAWEERGSFAHSLAHVLHHRIESSFVRSKVSLCLPSPDRSSDDARFPLITPARGIHAASRTPLPAQKST